MAEIYSPNDWRNFLIHKGVAGGSTKYVWDNGKNSSEYNHDWYMANQNEHLAKMRELYWKRKNGGKGPSDEDSKEKESDAAEETKAKAETKEAAVDSKIEIEDDAPEWLKNYAAEIEKVRKATGNPNWVPAHVNDFDAWQKELKETYPDLNLSTDAAKEVWGTLNKKFGGEKKSSSTASASTQTTTKSTSSTSTKTSNSTKASSGTSNQNVTKEHKVDDFLKEAENADNTNRAVNTLINNYNRGAAGGRAYNYTKSDPTSVGSTRSARDSFEAFKAQVEEEGGSFSSEAQAKAAWEKFKKSVRPMNNK